MSTAVPVHTANRPDLLVHEAGGEPGESGRGEPGRAEQALRGREVLGRAAERGRHLVARHRERVGDRVHQRHREQHPQTREHAVRERADGGDGQADRDHAQRSARLRRRVRRSARGRSWAA